jgi:hypothetical protein
MADGRWPEEVGRWPMSDGQKKLADGWKQYITAIGHRSSAIHLIPDT